MGFRIQNKRFFDVLVFIVLVLGAFSSAIAEIEFPGPQPGVSKFRLDGSRFVLENTVISCQWDSSGRLKPERFVDKLSWTTIEAGQAECFQLVLDDSRVLRASELRMVSMRMRKIVPESKSCRLGERFAGKEIFATLVSADKNLEVLWRAILRDGSNYVRQEITLTVKNAPIDIKEIVMWNLKAKAEVKGIVDGSPVVAGNMFFAFENPLSKSTSDSNGFKCSLPYTTRLAPGEQLEYSSVFGVVPAGHPAPGAVQGQLRRGFLYYIERERAHPYRPFLHYNSWYDIGYGPEKIQPEQFIAVVELFGKELIQKRGVAMQSFVLDDGWDDPASLWRFHEGFPDGFTPLKREVEKYDSVLGAWLSPFGGYGKAKEARLKYGRQQGFETNKSGFSLAGKKYFGRFRDVCVKMINDYGLNYFKFDGIGVGGRPAGTTAEFASDMQALLSLMSELRRVKPDVFINVTTGTWSSPFWLRYCDSTWRSGRDWGKYGAGTERRQQITYRDKEVYHNVVKRAPLYPLNSLMTQGVMFANHGLPKESEGLTEDIRDFFASGTDCQELYITPSLMSAENWDALAEAAKWSHDNADVLVDTHWVGGDPAEGEIYGWAAWSERKGILSLRNPSDKPGSITIDIGRAFELPNGAAQKYSLKSPWKEDAGSEAIVLKAGKTHTFELKPFDVLVFDAVAL
jgi:hypothetical protein